VGRGCESDGAAICCAGPPPAENQSTYLKELRFVGCNNDMPIAEARQFCKALQDLGTPKRSLGAIRAKGKALRKPAIDWRDLRKESQTSSRRQVMGDFERVSSKVKRAGKNSWVFQPSASKSGG